MGRQTGNFQVREINYLQKELEKGYWAGDNSPVNQQAAGSNPTRGTSLRFLRRLDSAITFGSGCRRRHSSMHRRKAIPRTSGGAWLKFWFGEQRNRAVLPSRIKSSSLIFWGRARSFSSSNSPKPTDISAGYNTSAVEDQTRLDCSTKSMKHRSTGIDDRISPISQFPIFGGGHGGTF